MKNINIKSFFTRLASSIKSEFLNNKNLLTYAFIFHGLIPSIISLGFHFKGGNIFVVLVSLFLAELIMLCVTSSRVFFWENLKVELLDNELKEGKVYVNKNDEWFKNTDDFEIGRTIRKEAA
jgi:uncharacterized membrane protein